MAAMLSQPQCIKLLSIPLASLYIYPSGISVQIKNTSIAQDVVLT